jgi:hypothetical protein
MRLQQATACDIVRAMIRWRFFLGLIVLAVTGCSTHGGAVPDRLKTRLLEREKQSRDRAAMARLEASQQQEAAGLIEVALPEPDLSSPVAELIPWKD